MAVFNDAALKYVLENEGGYADVPGDSGGKTRFGITEAVARANGYKGDMRDLPLEFAAEVYRMKYWSFDWVEDQRLAVKLFDAAVNFGPKAAILLLQKCLFGPDEWDGIAGPKTRTATNNVDPKVLIQAYAEAMEDRYRDLAVQPKNKKFLKGWLKRAERMP
jgi:lysozyme family protein